MLKYFVDYFRCPEAFAAFQCQKPVSPKEGFFRWGPETICYGANAVGQVSDSAHGFLFDSWPLTVRDGVGAQIPFDPDAVVDNLRKERYAHRTKQWRRTQTEPTALRSLYYSLRNLLPTFARRLLHRAYFSGWEQIPFPSWPVDFTVERLMEQLALLSLEGRDEERMPFIWFWPEGAPFCVVMTHDIETEEGLKHCQAVLDLDEAAGIRSALQVIPEERYRAMPAWREEVRRRGFEINVHDLNHDGKLFADHKTFEQRAAKINQYAREFGSKGFRSGALYRNVEWYDAFEFSYDLSVPNTGHLEVQHGGCCTVMPYFIGNILEIPLTTTQDYSLFNVLRDYSIGHWRRQLDQIASRHGLVSFIVHPDYLLGSAEQGVYRSLLAFLEEQRSAHRPWMTVPGEVDRWWRERSQSHLVAEGGGWRIEGLAKERARVAYAERRGDKVVFRLADAAAGASGRAGK